MSATDSGLRAEAISVRFGGHQALREVDLHAPLGAVTGLIGPNGAGKTTMFNVLCGLQRSVGGQVTLDGDDITRLAPHRRARRGLARTFQRLETFTLLSVADNIRTGAEFRRRWSKDPTKPSDVVDELIERLGLADVAQDRIDTLSTGRARIVELARALAARPQMLLLDEPSSGLDEAETEAMGAIIREVASSGPGVLLVEHDMAMVMAVCDQIAVLDFGAIVATGDPETVRNDALVQQAYLGADRGPSAARAKGRDRVPSAAAVGKPVLQVDGLRAGYGGIDVLHDVDLQVAQGEVFAVLGPNGAGKTTLLAAIGGLVTPSAGQVSILGHDITGADADALARAGLCTIPEGRGVFPNLTVAENLWMISHAGRSRSEIEDQAFTRFRRLGERRGQLAGTMSGGEQQMLAMARALTSDPALLLLDELSMGLAPLIVGELYDEVAALAESGLTIVVIEQFAHEVLGVADRAAIMLHGRLGPDGAPTDIADQLADAYLRGSTAHSSSSADRAVAP